MVSLASSLRSVMANSTEVSDDQVLDLLRRRGPLGVADLGEAIAVTATAVRQRLNRLMGQGLVERMVSSVGRGRPSHRYSLTEKARRQGGNNFGDLALALWEEVRAVKDPEVRRGLLERLSRRLAGLYAGKISGSSLESRLQSLRTLFAERRVDVDFSLQAGLPQLRILECPYPDLAEKDRGICALERMLFSELLGESLKLGQCRLDGAACCQFQTN